MKQDSFNKATILIATIGITLVFLGMIKGFLTAIFMAALFTGLLFPVFNRLKKWLKGKPSPAAFGTIFFFIFIILIPFAGFLLIVLDQAINASKTVGPIINEVIDNPKDLVRDLEAIPIIHKLFPEQEQLIKTIDDIINSLVNFVIDGLSEFSTGTATFIFNLFIFLFTMYYFLVYGKEYLKTLLYYLPLKDSEEQMLLARFTRVTKATLKGTFLIGFIQGGIGAIGMWIVGIPNVLFWGLVMTILSIIPALGPAIIWIPAAVILVLQGEVVNGIVLTAIGAIVIGNIDNLLRPRLVGKDAQMPDLMILFGTLGGLAMFGISGVITGPIIAALFITLWDIYGKAFKDYLYPVHIDEIEETLENILDGDDEEAKE